MNTDQKKPLIWLSLSVSTVAFFLIVAIRPTVITITKLIKEIEEKEAASLLLDKKINSLVAAQKVYAINSQRLPMLNQALPEKSEFPWLANFLESTALSSQVELSSLTFEKIDLNPAPPVSQSQKPSSGQTINFSTNAKGDYLNLKNFVSLLESSRRLIKIELTGISETKKKEEEIINTTLQLNISGVIFFENE
ncbi:hypothetical protein COS55_00375 [Candidatus Shapirobacteria bacterium CG03_land_8_20_14_0_80_40_19]|uniref:Uncharacterized protein n=4 Tax=Candidatus Shapironibacteriota TaxID=1752721 RepID=A0A2M7BG18_9BACT|nr:MAG: hypothetical protein COV89_03780 [Candidatus Shapirobacteria bacterium CG11_big_fil_rev_8_21_14_0_20_40_12]PIV02027.1 MAG: hypothetical protein COS55_00375 [Candidatus Shapirobacteria bacterium CG03_land_8_20_14_0_80_40_19]PJC29258.1 MAG: hypothetical protein CO053_00020 [Candidatus Shapirobacteria bacterium CG_4_9_14_0_2_um_filter_40_11]PJC76191.1 MAG: hypothetical protein CO010_03195 [Candidatus Shapirobacteria bacterium CG_4_8_14_3_um_filter_39_11]